MPSVLLTKHGHSRFLLMWMPMKMTMTMLLFLVNGLRLCKLYWKAGSLSYLPQAALDLRRLS
jgi:hypothetical protein